MLFSNMIYIKLFIFAITLYSASSTIYRNDKYQEYQKDLILHSGPQLQNVFDRKLVEKEPLVTDIIMENDGYFLNTAARNFHGKIMTYIVPWDNTSYQVSKIWARKFDIIAPVWFLIRRIGSNYDIQKYQNGYIGFDDNWIKDMRKLGETNKKSLEVFPRFMFTEFTKEDFTTLFTYESERRTLNKMIIKTCHNYDLDGIVLDVWLELVHRVYDKHLLDLITVLSDDLKAEGFSLILALPVSHNNTMSYFTAQHFEYLYSYVDYFALHTFEYSSIDRPGPNAPLTWMKNTVETIVPSTVKNYISKREKILMGINLYGYDYTSDGGKHINGKKYLKLLKYAKNRLKFDDISIENFFIISESGGRHTVFYPTLYTINERIKLAEELGVGISLLDVSLGLNYFYDLI